MRAWVVAGVLLAGCGQLLGAEDEDVAPPAESGEDASADTSIGEAGVDGGGAQDGGAPTDGDASTDASLWKCVTDATGVFGYFNQDDCIAGRAMDFCEKTDAPVGEPCTWGQQDRLFCESCVLPDGSSAYNFDQTYCKCRWKITRSGG